MNHHDDSPHPGFVHRTCSPKRLAESENGSVEVWPCGVWHVRIREFSCCLSEGEASELFVLLGHALTERSTPCFERERAAHMLSFRKQRGEA
ncbi:MAG TPA: hypothetical protein VK524_12320 [Polyangiaceae bacterium]|nr:hypothetical protein [Polyangiaceae bacterium]